MWRYLRKRRALKAYRTKLFKHLRRTHGRKLYYTPDEVRSGVRDIRASDEFVCFALGMFTERALFDAHHAATGEICDYDAMRAEIFAHDGGSQPAADSGAGHWWSGDSVSCGDSGGSDCSGGDGGSGD